MNGILPWFILLLPFVATVVIVLLTRPLRGLSSFISVGASLVGFVCSCVVFVRSSLQAPEFTWIDLRPILYVPLGLVLDDLSKTMLLLVTGIGALIHIYSLGYMKEDEGKSRYFAALSFFMFSMLGVVLSNNFV